ncbi:outer membrane lipoprotein-sorting protein [Neisseria sp. Ec49-e6-T10]|uniref:outer membrane lipoprotein-sorting protein n=1 Tax=Neisseria sp. Ec49-e6-T10 TaxID=3140744 RepID=UPI003EB7D6B8
MKVPAIFASIISLLLFSTLVYADIDTKALNIIRQSDDVRSPNKPFRYTVTVLEYKSGETKPVNKQILDISMRFLKPENGIEADARSLARFVYPPKDKGKVMLSNWYDLWFYTPQLRRPIAISRSQRLLGQISNGDVIVTNFEYAYNSKLLGEEPCGKTVCYKLALERKSPEVTYPKVTYLVEKGNFRPYKASYFSLDNKLIKEVAYQNYKPLLGKDRPAKIIVVDARYSKGYSVMEYSDVRFESLPLSHFTKEYIQRGGS